MEIRCYSLKFPGLLLIVLILSVLISCKTEQKESIPAMNLPDSTFAYCCYQGISGKDSLILHLVYEPGAEGQMQINGFLHIGRQSAPIQVFSEPGTCRDSVLQLEITSIENAQAGRISVMLQENGIWEGILCGFSPQPSKIRFRNSLPTDGLSFESRSEDGSFRFKPVLKKPVARFAYHLLFSVDKKNEWLKDSVLREIHGDSLCQAGGYDVQKVFGMERNQFLQQFREDAAALVSDSSLSETLNYSKLYSTEVFYNQGGLLSLGLSEYQYLGGAHGMLYTRCANFNLRTGKRIRLSDLFSPGFETRLKAELNAAAKAKYQVKDLSEVLLVNEIEPGDNFYLSESGICFSYLPYEIAPFVMGEPLIYVSYTKLKDILKK